MKAFSIKEPGLYNYVHISDEMALGPEDVKIKIKKIGFCGSDLNTFKGGNPNVNFPVIPGHEIAGVIETVGKEVPANYKPGAKVSVLPYTTCGQCKSCLNGRSNACENNKTLGVQRDGALKEYLVVPYTKIISDLENLSFSEIALVEPLSVGFHAARRAMPKADEFMLVYGCGMVGLGAISKGAMEGAQVIAVDIDDEKLSLAKQMGAAYVVNSKTIDLKKEVSAITKGHGPDIVLEAIGLSETFRQAVEIVAFTGRVVYVGYAKTSVEYETRLFVLKELQILGARNAEKQDFEDVLKAFQDSKIPANELISMDVSFQEAGEALKAWSNNPGKVSKILVSLD